MSRLVQLQLDVSVAGTVVTAQVGGTIDEFADFSGLSRPGMTTLVLSMATVQRCNSTGVLRWTRFLQATPAGVRIVLKEVPAMIVHQMNIVPAFLAHPNISVESFYVAYACDACDRSESHLLMAADAQIGAMVAAPERNCGGCGKPLELDAVPERHFVFLKRARGHQ